MKIYMSKMFVPAGAYRIHDRKSRYLAAFFIIVAYDLLYQIKNRVQIHSYFTDPKLKLYDVADVLFTFSLSLVQPIARSAIRPQTIPSTDEQLDNPLLNCTNVLVPPNTIVTRTLDSDVLVCLVPFVVRIYLLLNNTLKSKIISKRCFSKCPKNAQMFFLYRTKWPPVQIQYNFTEVFLIMPSNKIAQMVSLHQTNGPPELKIAKYTNNIASLARNYNASLELRKT